MMLFSKHKTQTQCRFNLEPFKPSRCNKASFCISEESPNFVHVGVLEQKFYDTVLIITMYFFHLPPTSSHLHPLQVENCVSNSRLVVNEDDNGKFRLKKGQSADLFLYRPKPWRPKGFFNLESS